MPETTDLTAWLDRLEAVREAATPGPWDTYSETYIGAGADRFDYVGEVAVEEDAELIVDAVNALPALVTLAREVLAAIDEWESEAGSHVITRSKRATLLGCALRMRRVVSGLGVRR